MKRAFTLIEIIIVLAIISVLLTITLRFGSDRINNLKYQSSKEQFVAAYDQLYSQILTSNYHNGIRFDTMKITLLEGAEHITYQFDSGAKESSRVSGYLVLSGLLLNGETAEHIILTFTPYTLGCNISSNDKEEIQSGAIVHFSIRVEGKMSYCFEIKDDTCKLVEQTCTL